MTSNPSQMYLVDLDDTLLNTSKYKSDLFSNLAKTINPAGSYKESFVKIAELYTFYCQENNNITLIDNRSKNVIAVSEINHPNLNAYWFEHGQPKKPERVKSLRENLPANILRFERLSEIISHVQQEGVNISPERKG
jgi:hypothetical protein